MKKKGNTQFPLLYHTVPTEHGYTFYSSIWKVFLIFGACGGFRISPSRRNSFAATGKWETVEKIEISGRQQPRRETQFLN